MGQVETVKDLHVLSKLSGSDLDAEATNYSLERLTGSYSTVTMTFFAVAKPGADIVIPINTQVKTAGSSFDAPTTFTSTSQYTFPYSNIDAYFSYDRNRYEFTATFTCDSKGTIGNVSSELINVISGTISQIDGVTNYTAATGGADAEIDDDLRERIRLAKIGRDLNTVNGLRGYLRSLGFKDANAIRVEESGYERATGADAFVIDNSVSSISEEFIYRAAQPIYYFAKRPIREITTVTSESAGTLDSSQYNVHDDIISPLRRSYQANEFIEILPTAGVIEGTRIFITYTYYAATNQAQQTLNLAQNKILTADVLVKRAYPMYLYLTASLTLKANADAPATRNLVRNALSQFCDTYRLGDDIQKSDLVVVMQEGYGDYPVENVDAVVISSYYLRDELGVGYTPVNEVISLTNKQFVVYGSVVLT